MKGMCLTVSGLLALVAGGALLAFGMGMLSGSTAHLAAGGAFALAGLGALVHGLGMCPKCKTGK